jgi:hypothetical protein
MRILIGIIIPLFITSCASLTNNEQNNQPIDSFVELYKSSSWSDRLKAVESADSIRNSKTEKFLISAGSDSHERVRLAALEFLKNYNTAETRSFIRNIITSDNNKNIRWMATQSLVFISNTSDNDLFIKLCTDKDWLIREQAALGFFKTSTPEILEKNLQTITDLINDPSGNVRLIAINNIMYKNKVIRAELSKQLQTDSMIYRPEYLCAILKALTGYKLDEKTRTAAAQFLTHPNETVRIFAYTCIQSSDSIQDQ